MFVFIFIGPLKTDTKFEFVLLLWLLQYMRCFENHKVVTLEELSQTGQPVKRNPNCPRHPNESFKFYCYTCQVRGCFFVSREFDPFAVSNLTVGTI